MRLCNNQKKWIILLRIQFQTLNHVFDLIWLKVSDGEKWGASSSKFAEVTATRKESWVYTAQVGLTNLFNLKETKPGLTFRESWNNTGKIMLGFLEIQATMAGMMSGGSAAVTGFSGLSKLTTTTRVFKAADVAVDATGLVYDFTGNEKPLWLKVSTNYFSLNSINDLRKTKPKFENITDFSDIFDSNKETYIKK
jgi:hypothetical protein